MPHVVLYSRHDCHLCDDAKAILEQYGLTPVVVDIDDDAQLRECYNTCIPVVVIDGKERFRGKVNPVLLKRLIK